MTRVRAGFARGTLAGAAGAAAVALTQAALAAARGAPGAPPGRAWILGALVAALAAGAALGGGAGAALAAMGLLPRRGAAALAATLAAAAGGAAAAALTAGARASASAWRWPAVALAAALVGAGATTAALQRDALSALLAARPRAAAVACAVAGGGAAAMDLFLLPGLYPIFHGGLRLLAVAAFAGATLLLTARGAGAAATAAGAAPRAAVAAAPLGLISRGTLLAAASALVLVLVARGALEGQPGAGGGPAALGAWSPAAWSVLDRLAPPPKPPPRVLLTPAAAPAAGARLALLGADVFIITVDALRADHVGFEGSTRGLTPSLDRFAAGAAVATRVYTPAPNSSYALSSLFTAHWQFSRRRAFPDAARDPTLAEWMGGLGYRTVALLNEGIWHIDAERLQAYRDSALGFAEVTTDYSSADQRAVQILEAVRSSGGRLFLWAHLHDVHEPYDARPGFGPAAGTAPTHLSAADRYASEVAYTDAQLGALLDELVRLRPGAIFVVTADHGESFGEHGLYFHGTSLYEEELHVPFLLRAPGVTPGHSGALLSLCDVWPTVAAVLGVPPPAGLSGRSALDAFLTGAARGPAGRVVVAEIDGGRAAITEGAKLVCATSGAARTPGRCALRDLAADPAEARDAGAERPALLATLTAGLAAFDRDELARLPGSGAAPDAAHLALARAAVGDAAVAPALRALAADAAAGADLRGEAVTLLERLADAAAIPMLLRLAGDTTAPEGLRRAAAAAAGLMGATAARPLLLSLGAPPPPYDPARHFMALATLGDRDAAWEGVAACIRHPLPEVRDRALHLLAVLRDPRTEPALLAALGAWQTRPGAAAALGAIGDAAALPGLVAALGAEKQIQNRAVIVAAIGHIGGNTALDALLGQLAEPEDSIGILATLETEPGLASAAAAARAAGAARTIERPADWRCDAAGPGQACGALAAVTAIHPSALEPPRAATGAPECTSATLVLDARGPDGDLAATVEVRAGGARLGTVALGRDFREHHLALPLDPSSLRPASRPVERPFGPPSIELTWSSKSSAELGFLRYAAVICTRP